MYWTYVFVLSIKWFIYFLFSAQSTGDPHITTVDGLQYTFNGHMEYTLLTGHGFLLQGRTDLVYTTNPPPMATVFTSFAGQQQDYEGISSDVVELKLRSDGEGIGEDDNESH